MGCRVDIELYLRVLWRFRFLMIAGFLLAVALAFLSVVRVSPGGEPRFSFREDEEWVSRALLLVTEQGFPLGQTRFDNEEESISMAARFAELATIYARLATSDQVRALMLREGPIDEDKELIEAAAVLSNQWNSNSAPLPLISISAYATTGERAAQLALRATAAFREYLAAEQDANEIPAKKRVVMTEVNRSVPPELLAGRSKTLPVVVFLTIMLAVVGIAFLVENLRPRVRTARADEATVTPLPDSTRRTA
jgi:hypothetical protein